MIKRKGIKCIKVFKKDEIVAMTTFKGKFIICTKHGVYMYPSKKGKL